MSVTRDRPAPADGLALGTKHASTNNRGEWSAARESAGLGNELRAQPGILSGVGGSAAQAALFRWLDPLVAATALGAAFLVVQYHGGSAGLDFGQPGIELYHLLFAACFPLWWAAVFAVVDPYVPALGTAPQTRRILLACGVGSVYLIVLPLPAAGLARIVAVTVFVALAVSSTVGARAMLRHLGLRGSTIAPRRVLLVGSGPGARQIQARLEAAPAGRRIIGCVDTDFREAKRHARLPRVGTIDNLEAVLTTQLIDEVWIGLPARSCWDEIRSTIQACGRLGVDVRFPTDLFATATRAPRLEADATDTYLALSFVQRDLRLVVKRVVDIVGAAAALVALAPLLLTIALAIKLTSPGPVIFAQERYGLNRRRIRIYKFRTMVAGAEQLQDSVEHLNEAEGPVFKITHDPRVTLLGKVLRRTSLDELPQLVNVLRGEMSLVGPRPLPLRDVTRFSDPTHLRRFSVPPGLTCLWQISGRSRLGFHDWIRLDLKYIDEWSLTLDLRILLLTIPAVVRGSGAV
jgi:exopolysaccharide biosynthesis polyprenyl glycosylphosphotransferase